MFPLRGLIKELIIKTMIKLPSDSTELCLNFGFLRGKFNPRILQLDRLPSDWSEFIVKENYRFRLSEIDSRPLSFKNLNQM